ncbi:MAG: DUF2065 domain-containing protein [Desulfovibrionaceae bacterium]|nr:DUF2065 domain-containing protein [Desulfovibrionaceae bacterium]
MLFTLDLFVRAVGMAFILEGLVWALFPRGMHSVMREALTRGPGTLQMFGLCGIAVGLLIIWFAHSFL